MTQRKIPEETGDNLSRKRKTRQNKPAVYPREKIYSPIQLLNTGVDVALNATAAHIYTNKAMGTATSNTALSINFNQDSWVSMIAAKVELGGGAEHKYGEVYIDKIGTPNNMLSDIKMEKGHGLIVLDLNTYSPTVTGLFERDGSSRDHNLYMAPVLGDTLATTGGSVIRPPRLRGDSIVVDI